MSLEVGGRGRVALESCETHKTVIIFMALEVGVERASGFRIIRKALDSQHFHGFGNGGKGGAGPRIIRNAWDDYHFHGFGSAQAWGGWLQNHKKCMECTAFSWLGK